MLRAYAKYMRQGNSPFALDYIEDALRNNVDITRLLVRLFEARFDPAGDDRRRRERSACDDARGADRARPRRRGQPRPRPDPAVLPDPHPGHAAHQLLPAATSDGRPAALHLAQARAVRDPGPARAAAAVRDLRLLAAGRGRAPALRRGRARWAALVRPPRRLPHRGAGPGQGADGEEHRDRAGRRQGRVLLQAAARPQSDRDAWLAEGIACYTTFISGLLDITDNLVDGETVPPRDVVRHDGDDSYLVVAADKGTATFSDIANGVAKDYGFWLGDAFASGGSVGYDHKAMGITARGAWVSVQRHFREMGIDCQTEDFTCVGIGDMSGDVFGNGLLCSEHTRLVAAFDHRDIFLDPDPDPATSFAERKRLFELPRSSWQDYDASLISEGGGVFPRALKSIPLNDADPRRRSASTTTCEAMTPAELMRAILLAPVDLLWNGGIGTYVKGRERDPRRRRRQGQRRDPGRRPRAAGASASARAATSGSPRPAGSSTPRAVATASGRINTDFIDNSAGVDTSDHEVNIKILLDRVVRDGDLTEKQRNTLLAEMTDEVADAGARATTTSRTSRWPTPPPTRRRCCTCTRTG